MRGKFGTFTGRIYPWLTNRPAYALLTASDERLGRLQPQRFRGAWVGVMLISLLCGVGLVGLWGAAWAIYGDYDILIMPALVTAAVFVLWPFREALVSLAEAIGGRNPTARAASAAVLVLILIMCFMRMKSAPVYRHEYVLPAALAWIRPQQELYRVLLLMPLWGGWAMLITCQFCKVSDRTEPAVAALAKGCGPLATAACMGMLLAATIMYFNFLPWTQLSISAAAIIAAVGGGLVLCKLVGDLKRNVLLGTNLLTQIAFILTYLANR